MAEQNLLRPPSPSHAARETTPASDSGIPGFDFDKLYGNDILKLSDEDEARWSEETPTPCEYHGQRFPSINAAAKYIIETKDRYNLEKGASLHGGFMGSVHTVNGFVSSNPEYSALVVKVERFPHMTKAELRTDQARLATFPCFGSRR